MLDKAAMPNSNSGLTDNDPAYSKAPWRIYNLGNDRPVELMTYIEVLEKALNLRAKVKMLPLQPGDVNDTWADMVDTSKDFELGVRTSIEVGIERFVIWYREYYKV
jgi:UDP-glucuronate 4-epimerase